MINGTLITIDTSGRALQGSSLGSTLPNLSGVVNDNTLRIYAKDVYIPALVSAAGNNTFRLPVVLGNNKGIIYVNGDQYCLGVDYLIDGNKVTWLNPSVSIDPIDQVIVWGPANSYTANAITFEIIDMATQFTLSDGAHSGNPTIAINPDINDPNPDLYPYNQDAIFMFVNKLNYNPDTSFEWSESDNKIVWVDGVTNLVATDKVFLFYLNKVPTLPFLLGDVLYRSPVTITSNNQENIVLSAKPNSNLITSSNLFYNNDRKKYKYYSDYFIQFPNLKIPTSGNLNPQLLAGDTINLSYFYDSFAASSVIMVNQFITAGAITPAGNIYTVNRPPAGFALNLNKILVFQNGFYEPTSHYDYPGEISTTVSRNPRVAHNLTLNQLFWDRQPNIDGRQPIDLIPTDEITFSAFIDPASVSSLKLEYATRTSAGPDTYALQSAPKQNKVIVFYNSEAIFSQFGQFVINGSSIESLVYPRPPVGFTDDIAIMYFNEDSYASLWKFDQIDTSAGNIAEGVTMPIGSKLNDVNSSMLFKNGVRIKNTNYEIVPGYSNKAIRLIIGSGLSITQNDKLMLVHT